MITKGPTSIKETVGSENNEKEITVWEAAKIKTGEGKKTIDA